MNTTITATEANRWSVRALRWAPIAISLAFVAVMALAGSLLQALFWFNDVQRPIRWAACEVQPLLPPSRAAVGEGPPTTFRSLRASYDMCTVQYDLIKQTQSYWLVHVVGVVAVSMLVPGASRLLRSKQDLARVLTTSALAAMALPWLGQVAWTMSGVVGDAAVAATAVLDPVTGNLVSDNPPRPASGPTAHAGIIAGCILADLLVIVWMTRRAKRKSMQRQMADSALCPACGYVSGLRAVCPECGVPRTEALSKARGDTAPRWGLIGLTATGTVIVVLLLLSPFVLGWIGAALPDDSWYRLVPY